jgi:hypothetical protein
MSKNKVYLEKNTDRYRIAGKFTILQTMFSIIIAASIVIILYKAIC